ncbi:cytochrome c oxidase subunit 2A [Sporosarcina sp. ITBMC105]
MLVSWFGIYALFLSR